jgi:hypothetical protein
MVPAAMESMSALSAADQKSVEPHVVQNPYRVPGVRWYQPRVTSLSKWTSSTLAAVDAMWWPVIRRHGSQ